MRIGIFPGSFNPPHDGHLAIAKNLIKLNYLDKVIFVPVSNFYVKNELLDGEFRLDMLKIATKYDDRLCVSDYEIISEAQPYTYQTLDFFKNKFKDDTICLIVGTDNYLNLISWKNYEYLINNYEIIVIKRGEIKNDMDFKNVKFISFNIDFISSTDIRNKLKEGIQPKFLNKDVYNYILEKKLYIDDYENYK